MASLQGNSTTIIYNLSNLNNNIKINERSLTKCVDNSLTVDASIKQLSIGLFIFNVLLMIFHDKLSPFFKERGLTRLYYDLIFFINSSFLFTVIYLAFFK